MIRVLHLSSAWPDFQTQRSLELLRNLNDGLCVEHRFFTADPVCVGLPAAVMAMRWLRELKPDVVHAWGATALLATRMAKARGIVFTPTPGRLSRLCGAGYAACSTQAQREFLIESGWPAGNCVTIPIVTDLNRTGSRQELRAQLGFTDSDYVLLAAGESTIGAGHRTAVWAASMLNILNEGNRLLLWGRGDKTDALAHFASGFKRDTLLTIAEKKLDLPIEFETLPLAADVAIFAGAGYESAQSLAVCMTAGLPIVAPRTPTTLEFLQDDVSAILVEKATAKTLAQRLLELRRDPATAARLGQAAKARAAELFSKEKSLKAWREIYTQAAE